MNLESQTDKTFLDPGTMIAERYEIVRTIGRGGMATVYETLDHYLDKSKCALKVLNSEFSNNKDYVDRFIREVQLMHKVQHVNVVKTYQAGTSNGLLYFTLEFVEGVSLETLIRRKTAFPFTINNFINQCCYGLNAIHQEEIVHRDLKPANIIICPNGNVKITDFGVARPKESTLTKRNQKVGSVLYMAPEVWTGKPLTPSVDFYAFGIILYEIVTGKYPFPGNTPAELMNQHLKVLPLRPEQISNDCPQWLDRLIMSLIEKSPSQRPKSASEVLEFVRLASTGNIIIPKTKKTKRKSKKKYFKNFFNNMKTQKAKIILATMIGVVFAFFLAILFKSFSI